MALYAINGRPIPDPDNRTPPEHRITTRVVGDYNSLGVFISQKVGRDLTDIPLAWDALPVSEWSQILQPFSDEVSPMVTFFDVATNQMVSRPMRAEDISYQMLEGDRESGRWDTVYNCKLTLIDTGG